MSGIEESDGSETVRNSSPRANAFCGRVECGSRYKTYSTLYTISRPIEELQLPIGNMAFEAM